MTQPPSKAPRKGLITALEGGRSCRAAAWRFGVAASTAIRWFDRWGRFSSTRHREETVTPVAWRSMPGTSTIHAGKEGDLKWCLEAGLKNHGAHGVRKATGLFASLGCAQYEIMSIHGHTEAGTSW